MTKRSTTTKKSARMSDAQYVARFVAERAKLARAYCTLFKFWRDCARKNCRRERQCGGDPLRCLKRCESEVQRRAQWRARQDVLRATPADAGPPERMAREFLPGALADTPRH